MFMRPSRKLGIYKCALKNGLRNYFLRLRVCLPSGELRRLRREMKEDFKTAKFAKELATRIEARLCSWTDNCPEWAKEGSKRHKEIEILVLKDMFRQRRNVLRRVNATNREVDAFAESVMKRLNWHGLKLEICDEILNYAIGTKPKPSEAQMEI